MMRKLLLGLAVVAAIGVGYYAYTLAASATVRAETTREKYCRLYNITPQACNERDVEQDEFDEKVRRYRAEHGRFWCVFWYGTHPYCH